MRNPIQMMVALRGREDGNRTYSQNIKVNECDDKYIASSATHLTA